MADHTEDGRRFEGRGVAQRAATVLVAWDRRYRRQVALKPLGSRPRQSRIRAVVGVPAHRNLAMVRDEVVVDGSRYLVMDFVDGIRIDEWAKGASPHAVVARLDDVASALAHLHRQPNPVAHGALRPRNILVVDDARAVLVNPSVRRWWRPTVARDLRAFTSLAQQVSVPAQWRRARGMRRVGMAAALLLLLASLAVLQPRAEVPASAAPPRATTRGTAATPLVATPTLAASPAAEVAAPLRPLPEPRPSAAIVQAKRSRLGVYRTALEPLAQLLWPTAFDAYTVDDALLPVFQRRTVNLTPLWTHVVPLGDNWLYWYRSVDGENTTSPIETDGQLGLGDFEIGKTVGYTHIASDRHGTVLRYFAATGAVEVLRFDDGFLASRNSGSVASGYDRVVGLGRERFVLYRASTGEAVVMSVSGSDFPVTPLQLTAGWSLLTVAADGLLVGINPAGRGQVRHVRGGAVAVVQDFSLPHGRWDNSIAFDRGIVVFRSVDGAALIIPVGTDGRVGAAAEWKVPARSLVVSID